jgi:hypothetical protein
MSGIGNNLYPPIIGTYMPAFVRDTICKVYFSLSNYNNAEDIANVQVIVNNQSTNLSALSSSLYPAGIKVTKLLVDSDISSNDKYYIEINPEDLDGGIFELNQFYKVQIRFTGTGATPLTDNSKIAAWLVDNQLYFSEWSTVCLVKGIQKPLIALKGFTDTSSTTDRLIFTSEVLDLVGSMYFEDNEDETEYLKYYNVKIYTTSDDLLVFNSGNVYTNVYNPNEINYTLPYALEDGIGYKLIFTYYTINEYSESSTYTFSVIQNTIDALDATISAEADINNGRIKIEVKSTTTDEFFGNLTIRRASSKNNFVTWEDIHQTTIANGKALDYIWYDYTIESGVWYKYCAQQRNSNGDRGAIISIQNPIMLELDDMFLTRANMQFKIKYNPSISSFATTYTESTTNTLGSKYPFIRRNGRVQYKHFPISGLITAFCDEDNVYFSKDIAYGSNIDYYNNYNSDLDITNYNDYIYERLFREKVMEFLYADDVKLFRSNTEGNVLVRLMNISFTPNQSLGRMLYTFTATAYEIDDCTLENFEKYGIQTIGDYSTNVEYEFSKIGQITQEFKANEEVFNSISLKNKSLNSDKYIVTLNKLTWMKIEMNSNPYLIKMDAGTPIPLDSSENANDDTIYGYIVYINNKPIIVNPSGVYELNDIDTEITSIYFPVNTSAIIDYNAELSQSENKGLLYRRIQYSVVVGQIRGLYEMNEDVFKDIYSKYLFDYSSYYQSLTSLDEIKVEADPGVIIYIKDAFDDDYFKHEIGSTGVMEFYNKDSTIEGFYFAGVQLYEDSGADEVQDTEFRIVSGSYQDTDDITDPIKNGVYTVENERLIYYHDNWFNFSEDNIVQCPVYALIDYTCDLMKGEY